MSDTAAESILNRLALLEARMSRVEGSEYAGKSSDADTVDGIHASTVATADELLALDETAKLPASITGDADTVDGIHAADIDADKVDGKHGWELVEFPDRAPASPDARDDEFTETTLDGKWTESTTAGAHDHSTTWPSYIYIKFTGNQSYTITQSYAPGGAFSLTAKFHFAIQGNYQECSVSVFDSAENNGVVANYRYNGGYFVSLFTYANPTWTARLNRSFYEVHTIYLHLQRGSSNDWYLWYSLNGYTWQRVGTYAFAVTVAKLKVTVSQGGQTINTLAGIDWIRANWLTL